MKWALNIPLLDTQIYNQIQIYLDKKEQDGVVVYISCKGTSQQDDYSDQD